MKKLLIITCGLAIAAAVETQDGQVPAELRLNDSDNGTMNPTYSPVQKNAKQMGNAEMKNQSIGSSSPYLDSIIGANMATGHIPGVAACIVKHGEIPWIGTYGYANLETGTLMDTTTLFHLASVSKTFTVTALMQLWENNYFDLDEDINNHLSFEVRNPGYPSDPITFRQLCTHKSTIRDNFSIMPYFWGMDCPIPLDQYLFDYLNPEGTLYNPTLNYFSTHAPGTWFSYCNIAVALMGLLVEEMSGIPFSQFTHDSILTPLDMNETAWFLSEIDTTHMARPYFWDGTNYDPYPFYSYPDYPDGMLKSSADQLARFLLCYLDQGSLYGTEILHSSTVDTILTIQEGSTGLIWGRTMVPGVGYSWGHSGQEYGAQTWIALNTTNDIGAVVLFNTEASDIAIFGVLCRLMNYAKDSIFLTGVNEKNNLRIEELTIYPNPSKDKITIPSFTKAGNTQLSIFNISGEKVMERQLTDNETQIDISALPRGVYFVKLQNEKMVEVGKMVKE
jgi:CubicO group peptidase (beta-lactamase class C family)